MRILLVGHRYLKNLFYKLIIYAFAGCNTQPVQTAFLGTAQYLHSIGFRDFNDGFNKAVKSLSLQPRNVQSFRLQAAHPPFRMLIRVQ